MTPTKLLTTVHFLLLALGAVWSGRVAWSERADLSTAALYASITYGTAVGAIILCRDLLSRGEHVGSAALMGASGSGLLAKAGASAVGLLGLVGGVVVLIGADGETARWFLGGGLVLMGVAALVLARSRPPALPSR